MNRHRLIHYTLDENHVPVPMDVSLPEQFHAWALEMDRVRRVACDRPFEDVTVSTVFLGMDHRFMNDGPPVLFETMVFGGPYDQVQERACGWFEAHAIHRRWVRKAQWAPIMYPLELIASGAKQLWARLLLVLARKEGAR